MNWKTIRKHGLPPPNTHVLISSGDFTIVDIAMWYVDKEDKLMWQFGGTASSETVPRHRYPQIWMEIPLYTKHKKS